MTGGPPKANLRRMRTATPLDVSSLNLDTQHALDVAHVARVHPADLAEILRSDPSAFDRAVDACFAADALALAYERRVAETLAVAYARRHARILAALTAEQRAAIGVAS